MEYIYVTSPVFRELGPIPIKYTRSGANVNPPIDLDRIPDAAKSLVILMEDPDARERVHWMAWNIPVVRHIREERVMECEGKNDFGQCGYTGPFLPFGAHRYQFKVYALDIALLLPAGSTFAELTRSMNGHIVGSGELNGVFAGRKALQARTA